MLKLLTLYMALEIVQVSLCRVIIVHDAKFECSNYSYYIWFNTHIASFSYATSRTSAASRLFSASSTATSVGLALPIATAGLPSRVPQDRLFQARVSCGSHNKRLESLLIEVLDWAKEIFAASGVPTLASRRASGALAPRRTERRPPG